MFALTIKQPWVWAICEQGKRLENRTWAPYRSLVGNEFAIHAGKTLDRDVPEGSSIGSRSEVPPKSELVMGAVAAVATLRGYRTDPPLANDPQFWWFEGPYGWMLEDQVWVLPDPIPCTGHQGLWRLPGDIEDMVYEGLAKAMEVHSIES